MTAPAHSAYSGRSRTLFHRPEPGRRRVAPRHHPVGVAANQSVPCCPLARSFAFSLRFCLLCAGNAPMPDRPPGSTSPSPTAMLTLWERRRGRPAARRSLKRRNAPADTCDFCHRKQETRKVRPKTEVIGLAALKMPAGGVARRLSAAMQSVMVAPVFRSAWKRRI